MYDCIPLMTCHPEQKYIFIRNYRCIYVSLYSLAHTCSLRTDIELRMGYEREWSSTWMCASVSNVRWTGSNVIDAPKLCFSFAQTQAPKENRDMNELFLLANFPQRFFLLIAFITIILFLFQYQNIFFNIVY